MISTLTGANDFGLQAELQRLEKAFIEEQGDLALERLDGQEALIDHIREALVSLPFLASKKMVVLRNAGASQQFAEQAEELLGNVPETTDVIVVEPKLDKRTAYYKFLQKNTDFKEFSELDAGGLATWLVEAAKAANGSLKPTDARYLVERVGANQQILSNELEKLLLYSADISKRTIDVLTDPTPQSTIFELLDAAFAGRTERVLKLYGEQRALKVEPQQIIAMLAWQLHVLAVVKAAGDRSAEDIARQAKMSPFAVRKTQAIARKLTLGQIKALIADLLRIDTRSKRAAINLDDALQHYLLTLGQLGQVTSS